MLLFFYRNKPIPPKGIIMKKLRSASALKVGDGVFVEQVEGELVTHRHAAAITAKWVNGPLVTILTSRGYVELDERAPVEVA